MCLKAWHYSWGLGLGFRRDTENDPSVIVVASRYIDSEHGATSRNIQRLTVNLTRHLHWKGGRHMWTRNLYGPVPPSWTDATGLAAAHGSDSAGNTVLVERLHGVALITLQKPSVSTESVCSLSFRLCRLNTQRIERWTSTTCSLSLWPTK